MILLGENNKKMQVIHDLIAFIYFFFLKEAEAYKLIIVFTLLWHIYFLVLSFPKLFQISISLDLYNNLFLE